jgi:hypothetical protein
LFNERRFTVKVISETKRVISKGGYETAYTCHKDTDRLYNCRETSGFNTSPIIFGPKGFTRATLLGTPLGKNTDPNIYVAYGTCTKF